MTSFVFCFFFTSSHWYCLFFCSLSIGSMGVWGQRPANCISFSLCHHLLYFLFPLLPVSPSHIVYLYFIPPPLSPSVSTFLSLPPFFFSFLLLFGSIYQLAYPHYYIPFLLFTIVAPGKFFVPPISITLSNLAQLFVSYPPSLHCVGLGGQV